MELPLNIIPKPFPNICESTHERLSSHRNAHGNDTHVSAQPVIKIIRLPCNQSHPEIPTQPGTQVASCFQNRPAQTQASPQQRVSNPCKPDVSHLKPIPYPNSISKIQANTTTKSTPSTRIPIRQKHAFNPTKRASGTNGGQIPTFPSNSSMNSSIPDPSAKLRSRAPRTTPTSACPTPRPLHERELSEKSAETVRVMDWTIKHVKAAEKRVREQERAAYDEKEFLLRLRRWEAEMKLRKLVENQDEESEEDNEQHEGECSDKGTFQIDGQPGMPRYKDFFSERRKRCSAGLSIVLE